MTCVQWQEHGEALRILIMKSQPRLNLTAALTHSSKAIRRLNSEPIISPRYIHSLRLSNILRWIPLNHEGSYAPLSPTRLELCNDPQLSKQLYITTDHPSSLSIITWIQSQWLRGSANSNRTVENLYLSISTPPPMSGITTPPPLREEVAPLTLRAYSTHTLEHHFPQYTGSFPLSVAPLPTTNYHV